MLWLRVTSRQNCHSGSGRWWPGRRDPYRPRLGPSRSGGGGDADELGFGLYRLRTASIAASPRTVDLSNIVLRSVERAPHCSTSGR